MTNKGRLPQSQASLFDQLIMLVGVANDNGLYDAADWVRANLEAMRGTETRYATGGNDNGR
jgi:hypothetical protein